MPLGCLSSFNIGIINCNIFKYENEMRIEDQVCSLENAKKLKDLGVKQFSTCYWWEYDKDSWDLTISVYPSNPNTYISAFSSSELLDILPHKVDTKENEPFNFFRFNMEKSFIVDLEKLNMTYIYIVNYICDSTETAGENAWLRRALVKNMYDKNPADALAKMLIFLIENNLLENEKEAEDGHKTAIDCVKDGCKNE